MMKKHSNQITKFLFLLLSIILIATIMSIGVFAANSTEEVIVASGTTGSVNWKLDDAGTLTIYGTGAMANYDYDEYPWHSDRETITKIVVEDGITSIGEYAFYLCKKLTSITIPDSVTSIGYEAFSGCDSLEEITLPFIGGSATSNDFLAYIFDSVPSSLKTVNISRACDKIPDYAFYGCKEITTINIPDSVTSIGNCTFYNCSSLTSITIPDSVTSIGSYAFYNCSSLEEITLPFIGGSATSNQFLGYIFGASEYSKNNSYVPSSLKTVNVSNECNKIPDHAFYNCRSLTSINIPDSVTNIDRYAFGGCINVISITIPDSVTSIGRYAFYNCSSLVEITLPFIGSMADANQCFGYIFGASEYSKNNSYVPSSLKTVNVSNECNKIPDHAFYNCRSLTSITIPDGVTTIGSHAFDNCSSLTSITIPDTVTSIGFFTFENCSSLTSITIPDSVTYISKYAFYDCSKLKTVFYKGTRGQKSAISIGSYNYTLSDATWHYKVKDGEQHIISDEWTIDKEPTCTTKGSKSHHCSSCETKADVTAIPKLAHTYKSNTSKATPTANGIKVTKCTVCRKVKSTDTVCYRPSKFTLSATSYNYNGSAKKPTVTIKDVKGNKLENGVDYTVSYDSGRKLPGKYKVTVTFKGDYSGTKSLYFTIKPKAPSKLTVSSRSTSTIKLSWPKVTGATGYKLYRYNASTGEYKLVKTTASTSLIVTGLKSATNYKYAVRAYKKASDGTIILSARKIINTTTRPVAPVIESIKSPSKGKVNLMWSDVARESGYQIYYSTSKNGKYELFDLTSLNDVFESYNGLKSGRTYYFKVRAYKTVNGSKVYSSFSLIKGIKIK